MSDKTQKSKFVFCYNLNLYFILCVRQFCLCVSLHHVHACSVCRGLKGALAPLGMDSDMQTVRGLVSAGQPGSSARMSTLNHSATSLVQLKLLRFITQVPRTMLKIILMLSTILHVISDKYNQILPMVP